MTINYSNIKTLDDLNLVGKLIRNGVLKMPNISKLSKFLSKDRKTVRKALNGFVPSKTRKKVKLLDEYRDIILKLLCDEHRSFDYYQHLYNFLKREYNIDCSYSTLRNYLIKDDELSKYFKKSKKKFTERFETEPGEQVQFDFKERVPIINSNGSKSKVYIATMTFGFSRVNVRKLVLDTKLETVLSFFAETFDKINGVPKEIVIDNIKCLVDKPRTKDKDAILNTKFSEFCKEYGIKAKPCMPYRPQTKGKTETQNKVPEQLKNYNGTYIDLYQVQDKLDIINDEDNSKISQATGLPPLLLFRKEKEGFNPLPSKIIRSKYYLKLNEVIVGIDSMFSYKSSRYSVPKEFISKTIGIIVKNNQLHVYYNNKIITCHQISEKKINIVNCNIKCILIF